ncbi:unnamed protein product [Gordionus sp. m RMFG-2023]
MHSISKKCDELKKQYDQCFNTWFSEKFLKGQTEDTCASIFKEYKKCLDEEIIKKGIDLKELNILTTTNEDE